jgi:hypothetical protein
MYIPKLNWWNLSTPNLNHLVSDLALCIELMPAVKRIGHHCQGDSSAGGDITNKFSLVDVIAAPWGRIMCDKWYMIHIYACGENDTALREQGWH